MSAPRGPLPGFRDFYPVEMAERQYLMARWRDVARRYGFVEYDGPPLEPLELYTKKSGDEIVGQLYAFKDKGNRDVALRPEMTPTLARMVGARANAMRKPIRWFSTPQLFRYERQQRGRLREHFQLNVDIIGEADVTADAELLAVAIDVMRSFGLTSDDVRARVSDRGLLERLLRNAGVETPQLPTVYAVVDKMEREPRASLERKLADAGFAEVGIARIFEVLQSRDLESLRQEHGARPELSDDFARLARYFECLAALGVGEWVQFDLSIVRGLAYYTGIVFELFDARGEMRAICGGGRYDNLLGALGGVDLPALGFGMGDVVLSDLLRTRGLMHTDQRPLDVWIAFSEDGGLPTALRVASSLRQRGRAVEYSLGGQKLARQLKAADTAGAAQVLIVGTPDVAPGDAILKRLSDGHEERVRLAEWIERQ
ncbi:MAG TPA: histidine--tRNA ligase [Gemmatimonadaceae bacterium]|nr:histidine--tRNA ligase [Gemmatimonadaceae bacterium]